MDDLDVSDPTDGDAELIDLPDRVVLCDPRSTEAWLRSDRAVDLREWR